MDASPFEGDRFDASTFPYNKLCFSIVYLLQIIISQTSDETGLYHF